MQRPAHSLASMLFGVATAGYGAVVLADPGKLLRPVGLAEGAGPTARRLARVVGVRDVVSGAAIILAVADGRPERIRGALALRAAGDLSDVAWILALAPRRRKLLGAAVASVWAASALGLRRTAPAH